MDSEFDLIDSRRGSEVIKNIRRKVSENEAATFEEAITATKFGKFNFILACLAMVASFCAVFDTTSMSYTFVAAECDLNLTLNDKGNLNSFIYLGMMSSAIIWGFLFDVLGRRRLLTIGFLLEGMLVYMSTLTQNLTLLLVCRYFQGFIINGPFTALNAYMSEFHAAKYRPTFQLLIGTCMGLGTIVLPLLAWLILPKNMDFTLLNLKFHSWNVFLAVTGIPAILSGLIFILFPESPKFLMMCGENERALAVFKKVYRVNTGMPEDTFPIKRLVDETKLSVNNKYGGKVTAQRTKIQALKEGFQQIKPLFFKPHLARVSLTCSILFFVLMGLNTLRLWLPQIFQVMTDYKLAHNGSSASLCTMLDSSISSKTNVTTEECVVNTDNSTVYINSAIVGFTGVCLSSSVAIIIRFLGKKKILLSAELIAGLACLGMYFSKDPSVALACSAFFVACGSICSNVMTSITVDLFPTTLRTLALSMGLMIGRMGSMCGNLVFPFLLESGCEPPFIAVAALMGIALILSTFLPNTDMQALV